MKKSIPLLTPYKMGEFELSHRVVLAPLTRQRSPGGVPQPQHAAVYYSQRATAGGLLISEATLVAGVTAECFGGVPGIWAPEHVDAWRPVVDAVHAKGAVFFCQLWHVPRRRRRGDDGEIMQVSPQMSFDGRREELSSPRRVAAADAPHVVDCFRNAARNAIEAGFDGVEILGANAYFVSSFSDAGAEEDDDEICGSGGGIESRIRFATEVISAVVREVGGYRVGIRLDQFPSSSTTGAGEEEEEDLALAVVKSLNGHGVLYCHMIEPRAKDGSRLRGPSRRLAPFREAFGGTFVASGGYGREEGDRAVGAGHADLVAFGRLFLANPDLPRRFELGAPLNGCDRATFYGGGGDPGVGYTDYPFLA